jgi:hypothetical protein
VLGELQQPLSLGRVAPDCRASFRMGRTVTCGRNRVDRSKGEGRRGERTGNAEQQSEVIAPVHAAVSRSLRGRTARLRQAEPAEAKKPLQLEMSSQPSHSGAKVFFQSEIDCLA